MKKIWISPWVWFSPFLFIFILLVLKLHSDEMIGDEQRYIDFANNLCNGFYSPVSKLNLWNGPGYPIILMPFVALKLPLISITLSNALFQYLSIIMLYKSLVIITNKKAALFFTLFWALYYVSYQEMPNILTETFTSFLATLIVYLLIKLFNSNSRKYLVAAGLAIGFLVLTKIIFGYVLLCSLALYFIAFIFSKFQKTASFFKVKKILIVLCIALATITPYLAYTYTLTGRLFYFGNSGGMSLYWMSTPFENEFGEWNSYTFDAYCKEGRPCNAAFIGKNHQADFDIINKYTGVEQDDIFKKMALENIKKHPVKYLRNCISNLGRIWFGYPTAAFYQQDIILVRFIPNSIILTFFLLGIPLWIINLKRVRSEINFLMVFIFLYLGASILISAYPRQLYVIVPVLIVWMANLLPRMMKVKLKIE